MANIVPKLNLNKTPNLVDPNSLIFAKNIRFDVDNCLHADYGISPLSIKESTKDNKLIDYNTVISRAISDMEVAIAAFNDTDYKKTEYYNYFVDKLKKLFNYKNYVENWYKGTGQVVGVITASNEFYLFISGNYSTSVTQSDDDKVVFSENCIICYDEKEDKFVPCNCNWTYTGGKIVGNVINNLLGEKILNIGEQVETSDLIPFKSINLNKSSYTDDESLYTQTPNIPITNVNYIDDFSYVIPNGVYQFFIRYKIRDDFYTNWFPASREIFAGNTNKMITNFGTVKFTNIHTDSYNSFILGIDHLYAEYTKNYESFQIGFILSHDDAIYARAWKHFDFNVTTINFDYKATDALEIEVIDLLKTTYQLYNVGNITNFKNKLYISNYIETNFNENLQSYADEIKINVKDSIVDGNSTYGDYPVIVPNNKIIGIEVDDKKLYLATGYSTDKTIIEELLNIKSNDKSINDYLDKLLSKTFDVATNRYSVNTYRTKYDFQANISCISREETADKILSGIKREKETIERVTVNGHKIEATSLNVINYIKETIKGIDFNGNFVDTNNAICNTFNIDITIKYNYQVNSFDSGYQKVPIGGFEPGETVPPQVNKSTRTVIGGESQFPDFSDQTPIGGTTIQVKTANYTHRITITFVTDKSKLSIRDHVSLTKYTTLIPYQKYKFYIHFVKQTGEITNGYLCSNANTGLGRSDIIEAPYRANCNAIIYPEFTNIRIPKGYVACFFSILHFATNTSTIFDITKLEAITEVTDGGGVRENIIEGKCIELNTRLSPGIKNIKCKQEDKELVGNYYPSSETTKIRYFGADGRIMLKNKDGRIDTINENDLIYVVNDYETQENANIELVKCTNYIKAYSFNISELKPIIPKIVESDKVVGLPIQIPDDNNIAFKQFTIKYSDYSNMNLGGYICNIYPLDTEITSKYYTDGSSVYEKISDGDIQVHDASEVTGLPLQLKELSKYLEKDESTGKNLPACANFILKHTEGLFIYSNYNFNYLSLVEDIKNTIKSYYTTSEEAVLDKKDTKAEQVVWRLITSATMSDAYELVSMYHSYTRKTFLPYNKDSINKFDNTIRSSKLVGDENKIDIFEFDANDYYNVPTNRGTITNLVAVGESIVVHTKDSMFRFSGSNTLSSNDGEIQTTESQPFDTGINEIFGSEFGFAGLQNKNDCIITEIGYIFYDRDAKIIYMYTGNGQIIKLSDSIEYILKNDKNPNIYFANDFYNNRIFICISLNSNKAVTLSYCLLEDSKSFISIHDFYYKKSFNTKTKCYFLTNDNLDVCTIDKTINNTYSKLSITQNTLYPTKFDVIKSSIMTDTGFSNVRLTTKYYSIIDIINNTNYETIKTLDYIDWCSKNITYDSLEINEDDVSTLNMAEEPHDFQLCKGLRIYTDTCSTDYINFDDIANKLSINNPESYKYPRFNQGKWSLNYFRDIRNTNDIFNYLGHQENGDLKYDDGRHTDYDDNMIRPQYISDNNGLIDGKYFVTRFFFNTNFKFETINLTYKEKI